MIELEIKVIPPEVILNAVTGGNELGVREQFMECKLRFLDQPSCQLGGVAVLASAICAMFASRISSSSVVWPEASLTGCCTPMLDAGKATNTSWMA